MPELPDVETFKRYLNATSLHQKILNVDLKDRSLLGKVSSQSLQRRLQAHSFEKSRRHGKYFFAGTENGNWLVLHFGMTGFIRYFKDGKKDCEHVRMAIEFNNGYNLLYNCQRRLGLIDLTENVEEFIKEHELGADPISDNMTLKEFLEIMLEHRGSIKSALMNQKILAGIGNVYSDEILFQIGLHPETEIRKLNNHHLKKVYESMMKVLSVTIENKANPEKLPQSYLMRHRTQGDKCPLCGGQVAKTRVDGRSSYYCRNHQKQGSDLN